jgi:hypothetical protein
VSTAELLDGSVTTQKLADSSVTVEKLFGSRPGFVSAKLTLDPAKGAIAGVFVTGEFVDTTPPPAPAFPLVFVTTSTDGAIFGYRLEFHRLVAGNRPFAGYVAWFTNEVALATEIIVTAYLFRRP